ncbi:MAG: twin-arginine translocase TatA/TatE family subunit [Xanthobacteraceae bacterium]
MDLFSIWHWLILGLVVLLLFGGRGKLSDVMGDVAKGIKLFKKGLADNAEAAPQPDTPLETADHQVSAACQQRSEPEPKP